MSEYKVVIKDLLEEQSLGFGEPWRYQSTAGIIVPILLKSGEIYDRQYVLYSEAEKEVKLVDTGSITQLNITNSGKRFVLIKSGRMIKGGTQPRVMVRSQIFEPISKTITVPIRCVQASHGITMGARFMGAGTAPMVMADILYGYGTVGTQRKVWSTVKDIGAMYHMDTDGMGMRTADVSSGLLGRSFANSYYRAGGVAAGFSLSDSLVDLQDNIHKVGKFDEMLTHVPVLANQIGAIFFKGSNLLGMELYNSPESWKANYSDSVEKYGNHLAEELDESLLDIKVKEDNLKTRITEFLNDILATDERDVRNSENSKSVIIENKKLVGEYVTLNGKTIYIVIISRDKKNNTCMTKDNPVGAENIEPTTDINWMTYDSTGTDNDMNNWRLTT